MQKGSIIESNSKIRKFCAYVRVSTEFQTTENQILEIERYCKTNDIIIIDWFKDEGISAFKERPQFEKMKIAVASHLYDGIIAVKLDRIGRSVINLCENMSFFKDNGCDVIFVKDNIDTSTPTGRLFFHLQSAFAEYEAELIRERTKLGMARVKVSGSKSGKSIGRPKQKIKDELIRKMYIENNKGLIKINKETGLSITAIRCRLLKMGVKLRTCNFQMKKAENRENVE